MTSNLEASCHFLILGSKYLEILLGSVRLHPKNVGMPFKYAETAQTKDGGLENLEMTKDTGVKNREELSVSSSCHLWSSDVGANI